MKSIKVGKSKKFVKPIFQDVADLFYDKGVRNKTEAKKFFAYYDSIGWVIGRRPMRSWRAAVAGWVLRMQDFAPAPNLGAPVIKMQITKTPQVIEEEAQIRRAYAKQKID